MKPTALLFAALTAFLPVQAYSQDSSTWVNRTLGYNDDGSPRNGRFFCRNGNCYHIRGRARRYREETRYREESRYREPTRVYGYMRRFEDEEVTCRETRRVVGDQHLTVEGAKKAANDAWAGAVRFHLGEKYMDLANARRVSYTCSRSSIKEGSVTTLGQTFTRCEVEAQPCHAPRTNDDGDR
jgi:hypothetical protein